MPFPIGVQHVFCLLVITLSLNVSLAVKASAQEEAGTNAATENQPMCDFQAQYSITKELVTQAEVDDHRRKILDINSAFSSGSLNAANRELLENSARVQVGELTLVSLREAGQLPETRQKLLRTIDFRAKSQAKDFFLERLTIEAEKLLDNHIQVRLQAIFLLRGLNKESAALGKGTPAVPFLGAFDVLLNVVNDPCQMDAVKIAAISGLNRICQDAQPKVEQRYRYSQVLINELNADNVHPWLQAACVRGLGSVDYLYDESRRPQVVQELLKVLRDDKRTWAVRSEAAKALGRCPLESSLNIELIVYDIVKLNQQMASDYNTSKNKRLMTADFFRVYLAFKPYDEQELNAKRGLLEQAKMAKLRAQKNLIDSAYQVVLPVSNVVFSGTGQNIGKSELDALAKWLNDNKPANPNQVASNLPQLP